MNTKITWYCSVSLFPQNNPSGFLAKALWVLPPHNPSCATACNCHQKTAKVFSTDCSSYSMYLSSEVQPTKDWHFKTELPTCIMQFYLAGIMSGIFQGSGILTINTCYFTMCTMKIPSCFTGLSCQASIFITQNILRWFLFQSNRHFFYCSGEFTKQKPTCNDVIDALWPCRTAKGAQVRRHQTLIILSQLPAAIMVFS